MTVPELFFGAIVLNPTFSTESYRRNSAKKQKEQLNQLELTQRHSMLECHASQITTLMRDSGVILDLTGTYWRQMQKGCNIQKGMTEDEAEKKTDEMIAAYEGEGSFSTQLSVWTWQQAEELMPMTSPTASETLRRLKLQIQPGQAVVIAIGRHGNSYGIVELSESNSQS